MKIHKLFKKVDALKLSMKQIKYAVIHLKKIFGSNGADCEDAEKMERNMRKRDKKDIPRFLVSMMLNLEKVIEKAKQLQSAALDAIYEDYL